MSCIVTASVCLGLEQKSNLVLEANYFSYALNILLSGGGGVLVVWWLACLSPPRIGY